MKHLKKGRVFGRKKGQRKAMLKILAGELLMRDKITTTEAKAKELKGMIDGLIGRAKLIHSEDKAKRLTALRLIRAQIPKNITPKKIAEIGKNFSSQKSGYARVVKTGQRKSDGARMAIIELIKDKP